MSRSLRRSLASPAASTAAATATRTATGAQSGSAPGSFGTWVKGERSMTTAGRSRTGPTQPMSRQSVAIAQ